MLSLKRLESRKTCASAIPQAGLALATAMCRPGYPDLVRAHLWWAAGSGPFFVLWAGPPSVPYPEATHGIVGDACWNGVHSTAGRDPPISLDNWKSNALLQACRVLIRA